MVQLVAAELDHPTCFTLPMQSCSGQTSTELAGAQFSTRTLLPMPIKPTNHYSDVELTQVKPAPGWGHSSPLEPKKPIKLGSPDHHPLKGVGGKGFYLSLF